MATCITFIAWCSLVVLSLCEFTICTNDENTAPNIPPTWLNECHQTKNQGINCSALSLVSFPGDIPDFVTSLNLSDNSIPIDASLPVGSNLRILSLSNNKIQGEIHWHFDENLPRLEELDLSRNKLSQYPVHLPARLEQLDLSRNLIESVNDIRLEGELEQLFLNENQISGNFELCVDSPHLDPKCPAAKVLKKLDLSKNAITGISNKGLQELSGLVVLSLSSNKIKSLTKFTFHGLRNLKFLDLGDNELASVHDKTFERLTSLKILYLRGNQLKVIPSKLPLLDWFDVSYNNIERVNETLKTSLYPIEMINMGHNPFHCDCHLLWLKEWYDRRAYILDYSVDIPVDEYVPSCASPEHLAGDRWDVLADQVFVCTPEDTMARPPQSHDRDTPGNEEQLASDTEKYVAAYDLHVQVRSVHATMVKLEWRAPPHYTNLLIQYFKADEEEETTLFAQIQATQGHHVLKKLDPESSYKICVLPKEEALAPLGDISDCLSVHTPAGEEGVGGARNGRLLWFQMDHTMESKFKMIFSCFSLSVVIVVCGVLFVECMVRLYAYTEKKHRD